MYNLVFVSTQAGPPRLPARAGAPAREDVSGSRAGTLPSDRSFGRACRQREAGPGRGGWDTRSGRGFPAATAAPAGRYAIRPGRLRRVEVGGVPCRMGTGSEGDRGHRSVTTSPLRPIRRLWCIQLSGREPTLFAMRCAMASATAWRASPQVHACLPDPMADVPQTPGVRPTSPAVARATERVRRHRAHTDHASEREVSDA